MNEFYKKLTTVPIPTDVVIAEIKLELHSSDREDMAVSVKARRRFFEVELTDKNYKFTFKLLPIRNEGISDSLVDSDISISNVDHIGFIQISETCFHQEEILEFVDEVEDYNWIHRKSPYIVPGCMVFDWMLQSIHKKSLKDNERKGEGFALGNCKLRFLHPLVAGERVYIYTKNSELVVLTTKKIVGKGIF